MQEKIGYDGHCHIFTLKYPLKEMKSLLREILFGQYPWEEPESAGGTVKMKSSRSLDLIEKIGQVLGWFSQILQASLGSEEENLDFLQEEARKIYPQTQWITTPLMMDIFYMFAYPLEGEASRKSLAAASLLDENSREDLEEAEKIWNDILDGLIKEVQGNAVKSRALTNSSKEWETALREIIESERNFSPDPEATLKVSARRGYHRTAGFTYHYDNLAKLVESRPGELYPFVAIDPRRKGMIDSLLKGDHVENGPFHGVKLYPRLGYKPQCDELKPVFEYCAQKGIPITTHCGDGGFPPTYNWDYCDWGNPANFIEALEQNENLRIDFAHFGNGKALIEWSDTILGLMKDHPGVYSDFSCYTEESALDRGRELWENNEIVRERTLFGTDFDVMYFTGILTMEDYFNNFRKRFTEEELTVMMKDNTEKFLFGKIL
ncbi:MAG: amidohydrolase family protein [Spirochaetales bacterium]|nr:amidohydrolase family protein [Spirochaetales bacterium]